MILEKIAASTRKRVEERKKEVPFEKIKAQAEAMETNTGYPFYRALTQEDMSFICEVKKASPSKGIIAEKFPYLEIAREYEEAGASAISCLTEPEFFLGKDQYLKEIAGEVSIPVLRKDFVVDSYQIYEAKTLGASAVLLICTLLGEENLKEYLKITRALGMTALTEAHDEEEIRQALRAGADVIRGKQPEPEKFYSRCGKQSAAAKIYNRYTYSCGGKRYSQPRGYFQDERSRGGRCAHRGSAYEKREQKGDAELAEERRYR